MTILIFIFNFKEYRVALQHRTTSMAIQYRQEFQKNPHLKKRCAGGLGREDFIPCAAPALRNVCTAEVHATALNVVGLVPFSMRPAFELLEKEKKIKGQQERLQHREEDVVSASQGIINFLPEFMGVNADQQRVENPTSASLRSASIIAIEAKADAALAGGAAMTDAALGDATARLVIKNWIGITQPERNKLYKLGSSNKWAAQKSGGVFANFGGHATGTLHRVYQQATLAKKEAIERNKIKRKRRSNEDAVAKTEERIRQVGTKEAPGPLLIKGIANRWELGTNNRLFTKPDLISLAVVDGDLDEKELNKLANKLAVVTAMKNYFDTKKADLPRQPRNVGAPERFEE